MKVIYVAKHPTCGHVRAASIVEDESKAKLRNRAMKFLADALNDGLTFDRLTDIEVVRQGLKGCVTCERGDE